MKQIVEPTLLVDKAKCLHNIEEMSNKARKSSTILRPHFKTHHSAEIANWFRVYGVNSCTVSSPSMATYFAKNGWKDITIAFPFNPLASEQISKLASDIQLNILIESEESLRLANKELTQSVGFFIKIDVGTRRTGILPTNQKLIEKLITGTSKKIQFKGFLAHAGHTYSCKKLKEIHEIFIHSSKILVNLRQNFGGMISYGDTPSCSIAKDFSGFDEIRPGNFIFYDWMQYNFGVCTKDNIGVCLAAPVVAIHSERNELILYAGAVHLSKDYILEENKPCFGKVVFFSSQGWQTTIIGNVRSLSQEHAIVEMSETYLKSIKIGQLLGVLPVHSCLTTDLQGHYIEVGGAKINKIIKV